MDEIMKYMVIRDKIGRYIFIPIYYGMMDCCGFYRRILK